MNEAVIWRFFKSKGFSDCGIAGLMGNLFAESGLNPINLQNSFEKTLKMDDTTYTLAVDSGAYTNFVRLIDSLCTMSKVVNAPVEEEKVG